MIKTIDLEKEYGLVLEGGGAKGAYQIGVWKALRDYNVKIKGVSGVSVGALNGAFICMNEYEKAKQLWENITYSKIMNVNDHEMEKFITHDLKAISFSEFTNLAGKFLLDRGFDVNPLKELIDENIDEEKIRNSEIELILSTFSVSGLKEVEIKALDTDIENLKDYLLASCYFPAFKNEKIHGKKYIDGGIVNNVPIDSLINLGYKDIIVVRIYGIGLEKKVKIPEDVNIIEIAPRVNLGSLLEFNSKKSKRNMKIGYFDGLRCLHNLSGKIYYINAKKDEAYYLDKIIHFHQSVKMALLEYYKLDYTKEHLYTRQMVEIVCKSIASDLKLEKEWTYKHLYIAMLELCALNLRIAKYKIYSEEALEQLIKVKYKRERDQGTSYKILIELIMKAVTIKENE